MAGRTRCSCYIIYENICKVLLYAIFFHFHFFQYFTLKKYELIEPMTARWAPNLGDRPYIFTLFNDHPKRCDIFFCVGNSVLESAQCKKIFFFMFDYKKDEETSKRFWVTKIDGTIYVSYFVFLLPHLNIFKWEEKNVCSMCGVVKRSMLTVNLNR